MAAEGTIRLSHGFQLCRICFLAGPMPATNLRNARATHTYRTHKNLQKHERICTGKPTCNLKVAAGSDMHTPVKKHMQ